MLFFSPEQNTFNHSGLMARSRLRVDLTSE